MSISKEVVNDIRPGVHVLVVGLGKSGQAAIIFLRQLGARVSVSEAGTKENLDDDLVQWLSKEGVFLETGGHSPDLFTSAELIVLSPGVPLELPAVKAAQRQGVPVIGEMGLAAQFLKTPMAAVTGTNGKSTVTTLLGELFRASGKKAFVGGNLGTPLTEYLLGPQDDDVVVAEVSSFQLDSAGVFKPDAALLLNISPDHLDRYEDFNAYAESKMSIFAGLGKKGVAIVNADDTECMERIDRIPQCRRYYFGENLTGRSGAELHGNRIVLVGVEGMDGGNESYDLSASCLCEQPNTQNAMAAVLTARLMGCSKEGIRKGIQGFVPLAHRMALVAEIDGVGYYDDSKATNVGAVYSALCGMTRPVILIAGGRDKGGEYGLLNDPVREKVKSMLLIGEAASKMADVFKTMTQVSLAGSLEEAVQKAYGIAEPGDAVLLSPACASFDMFTSYKQRGEVFRESVLALKAENGANRQGLMMGEACRHNPAA